MGKKRNDRRGIIYSTDPDFEYKEEVDEQETLPPQQQKLILRMDRKHRKGKEATLVEGFSGNEEDLKDLAKLLKTKCGVGGSTKDGYIIIQGSIQKKVAEILLDLGYQVKIR